MANIPIKPWDLPAATPVANASIVGGNGAVVQKYTPAQIVDVAAPLSSQEDAESGTGNDNRMSALRVKQAIDAQSGNLAVSHSEAYQASTIGGKLNNIVYVTDAPFNAVPNDSTTGQAVLNLAAFNAAIEYVYNQGGGVVRVPPGDFYICRKPTPVTHEERYIRLRGGVYLEGDSIDSTRIVRAGPTSLFSNAPSTDSSFDLNGGDYRIANMTLDANPANYAYAANHMYFGCSHDITVENVRFLNAAGLHALDLNNVRNVNVIRCRFEGHDAALSVASGGASYRPESIQLAWITDAGNQPLGCENITVRDCVFGPSDTLGAPFVAVGGHSAALNAFMRNITVTGCTLDSCIYYGLRPYCWDGSNISGNLFIGCNVWITSNGNVNNAAGSPSGFAQSNADIKITRNTFLNVPTGGPVIGTSQAGGEGTANWAKVEGLSIVDNKIVDASPVSEALFVLRWANDVLVSGNNHIGTRVRAVEQRFSSNVRVVDNSFDSYSTEAVTVTEATETYWANQGLSHNLTYHGNMIKGSGASGIRITGDIRVVSVKDNQMTGLGTSNPRSGVRLQSGVTGATVSGNIIDGVGGEILYGVEAASGSVNIIIGDNQITGATTAAYLHAGTGRLAAGGAGTPESVIIAPVGSTWGRTDGAASTSFYVKQSGGAAATGWAAK